MMLFLLRGWDILEGMNVVAFVGAFSLSVIWSSVASLLVVVVGGEVRMLFVLVFESLLLFRLVASLMLYVFVGVSEVL